MDDLNSLNKTTMMYGTYIGNGESTRTISLSFYPKCGIILQADGRTSASSYIRGGIVLINNPIRYNSNTEASGYTLYFLSISNDTLIIDNVSNENKFNAENEVFYYIMFA